jgi:dienelactone hydrolase
VSIDVTPANPSIALGTTQQFTATGTFSDGTQQDMTDSNSVTWSTSGPAGATVSNAADSHGLATSIAVGSVTIKASTTGVSGAATLTVTDATLVSIKVDPPISNIALATQQQFTATGTYTDNTTLDLTAAVSWSSSSPGVATISNAAGSNGIAIPVSVGGSTITASSGNFSAAATLTVTNATLVSVAVDPPNPSIILGTKQQFTAIGTFSDNTTQDLTTIVTWSSSSPDIATVSNAATFHGSATSVALGSSAITATLGGVSGTTTLTMYFDGTLALTPRNDIAGAGQEAWSFTYTEPGWDTTVTGFILKPVGSGPFPGVVLSHGKAGSAESITSDKGVAWFAPNGYISIAVDYTHAGDVSCAYSAAQCGGSPENVRRANRAFQILRGQDMINLIGEGDVVSRDCTLLYGNSLGALTTLELAEQLGSNVCAVALSAGGIFTNELFSYETPSGAAGVNQITAPVIHLHGRLDDIVPPTAEDTMSNAFDLYDKVHQQVWFPDGGHEIASASLTEQQVHDFVLGWFSVYLNHTAPNISSLSAVFGSEGDPVVISGSNFGTNVNGNSAVNIGGVAAGIVSWSDTSITATVPVGAVSGSLEVIVPVGPITDPYVEQPVKGGVRSNRMDFTVL